MEHEPEIGNKLVQKCYNGNVDEVVQICKEAPLSCINMCSTLGCGKKSNTPLNFAVLRCAKELETKDIHFAVSLILNRKLNGDLSQNVIDRLYGGVQIVRILLEYGADVNQTDETEHGYGLPPILNAALCGHIKVMHLLLAKNADINRRIEYNFTKYTANWSVPTVTPLIYAIQLKNTTAIQLILDANADIQKTYDAKNSPLHIAAIVGDCGIVETLLRHNASVNDLNEHGDSPLLVATSKCNCDIVETLLQHNARVDDPNERGESPLHIAARNCDIAMLEILLVNNARRDVQSYIEGTPLHVAIKVGNLQVVELLLEYIYIHDIDFHITGPGYNSMFVIRKGVTGLDVLETAVDTFINKKWQDHTNTHTSTSILVAILRAYPDYCCHKIQSERLDLLIFKCKKDSDIVKLMLMIDDRVDTHDLSPIIRQNVVNLLYKIKRARSKEDVKKLINNYKSNTEDSESDDEDLLLSETHTNILSESETILLSDYETGDDENIFSDSETET